MAQNVQKSAKKVEISILNVLFCLMVLAIHTLSAGMVGLEKNSWQFMVVYLPWNICSVAVYGFLFLSGVKLFLKFDRPFSAKEFYLRRASKIIIPYAVAVTVYYLAFCAIGAYRLGIVEWLKFFCLGNVASHFYFVVALVQFYLLMPLWRKIVASCSMPVALGAALAVNILFWSSANALIDLRGINHFTDRIFVSYVFYWLLGCYIGRYYEQFLQMLEKNKLLISLCFLAAVLGYLHFYYYTMYGGLKFQYVELWKHFYLSSAIVFLFMLAYELKNLPFSQSRLFLFWDRQSYNIYLWHMFFLLACEYALQRLPGLDMSIILILRAASVTVITAIVCFLWEKLKKGLKRSKEEKSR